MSEPKPLTPTDSLKPASLAQNFPMVPNRESQGAVIVVTGASKGIGQAIALAVSAAGAAVVTHGRSRDTLESGVAAKIRAMQGEALVLTGDLSEPAGQDELVHAAWNWRGRVDAWINNAGADVLTGPAAGWSFEEKLEALWRLDVTATMRISRAIGVKMKALGKGVIINVGWDQAETGMAGDSGELFAACKGAVMSFSRSLARTLAPEVRVHCLAPGWIKTAWGEHASEYWQERARAESLLGRWGTPEDVAQLARFLISPAAAFLNGQVWPVNGGSR